MLEFSDYCELFWMQWGRLPQVSPEMKLTPHVSRIICSFILYAQAWLT